MRRLASLFLSGVVLFAPLAADAQVSDAERAAARELFREGDELQRAGKTADALDKFQRAQAVYDAPTNILRVAQCQAALGRLVEAAESYRAMARAPLPSAAPPQFHAAIDEAEIELRQIEPRVPRLVVQLQPPNVPNPQMQIDGQSVSAALLGEPIPLDPGAHRVMIFASGFATSEQRVALAERDTKTLSITLRPIVGITSAPPGTVSNPPLLPPPPPLESSTPTNTPPAPPPIVDTDAEAARTQSRLGLLLGLHVGWELPSGAVPVDTQSIEASALSTGGVAYALDAGLRFARHWYAGLVVERASLGDGADPSKLDTATQKIDRVTSETTLAGAVVGFVANPERTSFYGEAGLANRWYSFTATASDGQSRSSSFSSGEIVLGAGVWVPVGRAFCLLPKATAGIGSFTTPDGARTTAGGNASSAHAFFMLGLAGFYNVRL